MLLVSAPLLLALAPAALPQDAPADQDPRPNVVLLFADDLGWMDLGCQGSSFYETPHLDALAASGARFSQAYAAAPVCSPTRVGLMSGQHPARLHTTDYFTGGRRGRLLPAEYDSALPLEQETLAELFGAQGYRTFFAGKWHLGGEGYGPLEQGFDHNVGGFQRGMPPGGYFSPYKNPALEDGPEGEHLTDRLTEECLSFLEGVGEDPFLLVLSWYAVHTPLQTKPELRAKYQAKADALPESEAPRFLPEGARQARQVQDHAVYAGMLESLDTSVGRVLAALEARGLDENTIVLFSSDNGGLSTSEGSPTSNVPLRAGKGWMYEGGIRVPLLLRAPGRTQAGSVFDEPVITMDIAPTLLELAGLGARPDQHLDGRSLVPLLSEGEAWAPRSLYWHYPHYGNQGGSPSGGVRRGPYKLIEWFEDGRLELYDLERDLGEQRELSAEQPELAAELSAELRAWRASVDARMPRPNPEYEQD